MGLLVYEAGWLTVYVSHLSLLARLRGIAGHVMQSEEDPGFCQALPDELSTSERSPEGPIM